MGAILACLSHMSMRDQRVQASPFLFKLNSVRITYLLEVPVLESNDCAFLNQISNWEALGRKQMVIIIKQSLKVKIRTTNDVAKELLPRLMCVVRAKWKSRYRYWHGLTGTLLDTEARFLCSA